MLTAGGIRATGAARTTGNTGKAEKGKKEDFDAAARKTRGK